MGFASEPPTRQTRPTPASQSRRRTALETRWGAFDVFSHCGPHALHVARLDDLKKHDVVGLQMLQKPRQRQPARKIDRELIGFASSGGANGNADPIVGAASKATPGTVVHDLN